ncbi:MAG: hypothetical protein R6T98_04285 [Desulfatiglandales bacterium]
MEQKLYFLHEKFEKIISSLKPAAVRVNRQLLDIVIWGKTAPRLGETTLVPTTTIKNACTLHKNNYSLFQGSIVNGDWDLHIFPLMNIKRILLMYKMYRHEPNSEQGFRDFLLEHGLEKSECENKIQRAWRVYESLKNRGFICQYAKTGVTSRVIREKSAVRASVTRSGEIVWNGSAHRMAASLALEFDVIPVSILWRHREWQLYRRDLYLRYKKGEDIPNDDSSHPDIMLLLERSSKWKNQFA